MRRNKGFGCLVPKGPGKPYLARWVYKGQVYTKSTCETDRRKALKVLERLTRPFREEREIDVWRSIESRIKSLEETKSAKPGISLDDLFSKFKKLPQNKDIGESTMNLYENVTKLMVEYFKSVKGLKSISEVTESDAESYLAKLSDEVGPETYNIRLVFFKRLWKDLDSRKNPFEKFQKRKISKMSKSRRPLNDNEIRNILAEISQNEDDELLFSLGIYTGLRVSDCALMKHEHVNLDTNTISVIPIKTKRHMSTPIEIPIHPSLRKILIKIGKKQNSEYLSERNAQMYKNKTLTERVRKIMETVGLRTSTKDSEGHTKFIYGFHSLRHTFVSNAINSGMSPLLVQKIVGHSNVDTTDNYFHANRKALEDGIAKIPDFAAQLQQQN